MQRVVVIGAGTMGHGIAQVCAASGLTVTLVDAKPEVLTQARGHIAASLDRMVQKGKLSADDAAATLARLTTSPTLAGTCADVDLVVEAVPEDLALKQRLLALAEADAPATAILASNTSSLSIGRIAAALTRPERFLGTHFFNPVPVMELLELVRGPATAPEVVDVGRTLGARLGKQVIVVNDAPGFATSRLGVALGMEAIRMVEQGVASAEDIDTAMVLGYRHPIGPLKLTDMVGLDVRMAIGEYLARELGNPAFEPPALMRELVAAGKLGKKAGEGFYRW